MLDMRMSCVVNFGRVCLSRRSCDNPHKILPGPNDISNWQMGTQDL